MSPLCCPCGVHRAPCVLLSTLGQVPAGKGSARCGGQELERNGERFAFMKWGAQACPCQCRGGA